MNAQDGHQGKANESHSGTSVAVTPKDRGAKVGWGCPWDGQGTGWAPLVSRVVASLLAGCVGNTEKSVCLSPAVADSHMFPEHVFLL